MAELPSGTVTFLLTDVEGSTALWEQAPEAMRAALGRHDALFEAAVQEHSGVHIRPRGEGDSRFAVFTGAADAVRAALAIQRAFAAEPWPTPRPLTVRIGLHTGEAELREGDYYGSTVNRCARIRGIGHGGQMLLSEATAALVRDSLPGRAVLRDLGTHRLKDVARPERVFQLAVPDLPADFPPPASLDTRRHNLPVQPTPLIGRQREIRALHTLFTRDDVRLVTLTGPGGTGKTRLGLQVAVEMIDHFADGAFFVALASIKDPELVPSSIAQTLGIRDVGGRPVLESLKEYLRERRLLLLLDNFEQILPAGPVIGELLAASPGLKVLVTSRAPLQVRGEHELAVPPLALPDSKQPPPAEALSRYAAVALFIARARAIKPDSAVAVENAPVVAEICHRLDGLPLAIELAAARTRLLSPRAILGRLERRLPLLTGGARDLPARHQTLRGAMAWSYELLEEAERALFRRLSIFVGGCTLEAAEAVAGLRTIALCGTQSSFLDLMASLVTKSLLRQEEGPEGEPRFGMLETIREYGLEQLEASGEAEATRGRHAAFFLTLAEEAAPKLHGREQLAWLRRLDLEHDNLRAILEWSRGGKIRADVGPRLAGALAWFWFFRGFSAEGYGWATAMLALPGAAAGTVARAQALQAVTVLASTQGDHSALRSCAKECAAVFRAVGDLRAAGRSLAEQALGEMSDRDYVAARSLLEESVAIAREVVDRWGFAFAVNQLGGVALHDGDYAAARAFREEAASAAREIGDRFTLGLALGGLALVARLEGNQEESAARFREVLVVSSELEDHYLMPRALAGLAGAAGLAADYERATRLFGAVETMREASGTREALTFRAINERDAADARAALGDETFAAAWAEGRAMSLEQAVAYALESEVPA